MPDIPGAKLAITSNEAFHLEALPSSIAIVGGGYIAVEFAGIFHGLGVPVTLVYRGEKILRGFDGDLRDGLTEALKKRGIDVRTGTDVTEHHQERRGLFTRTLTNGDPLQTGLVMFATGRVPEHRRAWSRKGRRRHRQIRRDHRRRVLEVVCAMAFTPSVT